MFDVCVSVVGYVASSAESWSDSSDQYHLRRAERSASNASRVTFAILTRLTTSGAPQDFLRV